MIYGVGVRAVKIGNPDNLVHSAHQQDNIGQWLVTHAYPLSFNLSLRAQRGNLVNVGNMVQATGSPRRCAPRDDKLGTHED